MTELPEPHSHVFVGLDTLPTLLYTSDKLIDYGRAEYKRALEQAMLICRAVYFDEYPDAETWERSAEHEAISALNEKQA